MRTVVPLLTAVLLLSPVAGQAQTLQDVARALGAANLKSIEIQGSGVSFQVGQSAVPGMPWPQFNVKSFARLVNYDTASLREEAVRVRALEPPRGGGPYVRGEQRQVFVLSGDHAWNVVADAAVPAPITLADRQFQLWSTPHGVVKAALAGQGTMQGRTIAFALPGRFKATATVDASNLIERVDATLTNPVLGDMAVTVTYAEYRDFGGLKFSTKIRQTYGGFPALDITVTDVRSNVAVEVPVPDNVRQTPNPYARVTSQKAADGVFYITGGTHHSVAIEMQDHVIVAEAPLNDARALAVLAEVRNLIPNKPIRYVVVSHHHFDHSGGVRAFAGEGITLVTHEVSKAFFERVITLPATVSPDHLAKSGRKAMVEGVRDRRVLSDGTRTVEIHHIAGSLHADDMLMVYLPKEKLLIEADAYTPPAANVAPMTPPNPFTVNREPHEAGARRRPDSSVARSHRAVRRASQGGGSLSLTWATRGPFGPRVREASVVTTMPTFVCEIEQELRVPGRCLPGHSVIEKREKRGYVEKGVYSTYAPEDIEDHVEVVACPLQGPRGATGQGVGPGSRRRAIQGTRIRNT